MGGKEGFLAGTRDMAPILLGVVPFAMISGIAAVGAGLSMASAMGMSVFIFAGAAQLAAVQLIGIGAAPLVIISTALIINLRFVMYSASLAPHFQHLTQRWKCLFAYLLTDQAYAVSISRFSIDRHIDRGWYYFGASFALWVVWQIFTLTGILLGSGVPKSWGLDFAVPLTFMVLLLKALGDKATVVAALVGGIIAVAAKPLPYNLGLLLAALCGIGAGLFLELLADKKSATEKL